MVANIHLVLICYLYPHPLILSPVLQTSDPVAWAMQFLASPFATIDRHYQPLSHSKCGAVTTLLDTHRRAALLCDSSRSWLTLLLWSSRSFDVAARTLVVGSHISGQHICPICNERSPKLLFGYRRFGTKYQRHI
jgi:hypothetical protein